MTVLFDTNVLLDALTARKPFCGSSQELLELSERNEIEGVISAISFNNIYYIVRKARSESVARDCLKKLRAIVKAIAVDEKLLNQALDSRIGDFEDAIQYFCSIRARASYLITRNPDDFPRSPEITIVTPEIFLSSWDRSKG